LLLGQLALKVQTAKIAVIYNPRNLERITRQYMESAVASGGSSDSV
jgi:hypothetical protein